MPDIVAKFGCAESSDAQFDFDVLLGPFLSSWLRDFPLQLWTTYDGGQWDEANRRRYCSSNIRQEERERGGHEWKIYVGPSCSTRMCVVYLYSPRTVKRDLRAPTRERSERCVTLCNHHTRSEKIGGDEKIAWKKKTYVKSHRGKMMIESQAHLRRWGNLHWQTKITIPLCWISRDDTQS